MACTATLKRSVELEALHSPQSPKRRRCSNLPGTPVSPSPKRCNLLSATGDNSSMSPQSTCGGEHRLTPEQIVQNLRQEYSRYQRRRKLEGAFNQSQSQSLSDGPGQSPGVMAPSAQPVSPGSSVKRDQPCFTLHQVGSLCERILKDHDENIREEYEQILNTKLAEQYESFVKFTHDQIMRQYGARPSSYVS
ncbi:akirin 1(2a) [Oncorhynchus mykiss]|uniref:Akirin 1(2a) n=1 Tax=Oncorhynchus mykiss TaxID=8022 RepID=C8BMC1_ONCMY|nr:akirin 1(2a) [Oncorhynchus mykiss]ACV49719.1 akirin 1(2a) [Oncorhynchus mykiss]